jgi:hypothetical protein
MDMRTTNEAYDSHGRRIAATEEALDAFWRFYQQSAIVDHATGRPLLLFHGTNADFAEFESTDGWYCQGMYFTDNAEWASEFAGEKGADADGGDNVIAAYLSIARPYVFRDVGTAEASNITLLRELGFSESEIKDAIERDQNAGELVTEQLCGMGHDGLIVLSPQGNEYIAFFAGQIKSAIGNPGSFDTCEGHMTDGHELRIGAPVHMGRPEDDDEEAPAARRRHRP